MSTKQLNLPIETPCGVVFPNRLVKAAMSEGLGKDADPDDRYISAYTNWGSGGWGGLLTGSVEVSSVFRNGNVGIAVKPTVTNATRAAWERWAMAAQKDGSPTLVQLSHPGRQSPAGAGSRSLFHKTIAPSPIPLDFSSGVLDRLFQKLVFGVPQEMSVPQIEEAVQQFAVAAKLAHESGFKGVELHGAHGYLISQFLSPKMNIRTDAYGGTPAKRTKFVIDIIRAVRKEVPSTFCVGIKLNSADVGGEANLEDSLEQFGLIAAEQIDFVEISGGSYEKPDTIVTGGDVTNGSVNSNGDARAARTAQREAFYIEYAKAVRARFPSLVLMVTGGFRSRSGIRAALESGACDLVGIARPAVVNPYLAKELFLNESVADEDAKMGLARYQGNWLVRHLPIKLINFGIDTMYYGTQIEAIAKGERGIAPPVLAK